MFLCIAFSNADYRALCRYQNGEKGEWCKSNLFELATRIPMYVRVPKSLTGNWARGVKSNGIVESVDLFATLIDLAGLVPPNQPLAGESLRPLLLVNSEGVDIDGVAPMAGVRNKTWALSQWPRRPSCVTHHACTDGHGNPYEMLPDQAIMGYKLRVDNWAYISWFGFDWGVGSDPHGDASVPIWDQVLAQELYDHHGDDGTMASGERLEWENVVADSANSALVAQLHAQLVATVKASLAPWQ